MRVTVSKSEVEGKVVIPSSKSQTIRGLVCAALADGERPTVRGIRERLAADWTATPSFRDIVPVIRAWRERHRQGRAVLNVAASYNRLDPEQRAAFRDLVGLRRRPDGERLDDLADTYGRAAEGDRRRLRDHVRG